MEVIESDKYEYSDVCLSLPYRGEQVSYLADRMKEAGFESIYPIRVWEGQILDGRHRYEAALEAGVEPEFLEFVGTPTEAWDYVSATNVEGIRHLTSTEKSFFYAQRANALGVQTRGGDRGNQYQSGNVTKVTMAPTQQDHADALGVTRKTINEWESDRKEVFENPDNSDLAAIATTPEGYKEAKKEAKSRADQIREDLSKLTPDEQVEYLGGPQKVVDQKALDNKLEKEFVPYNAALTVLNSLNRLRIFGGKREIKSNILHALDTSVRFQSYEAEALLLLAEVVEEHKEELKAMCLQEVDLNKLN